MDRRVKHVQQTEKQSQKRIGQKIRPKIKKDIRNRNTSSFIIRKLRKNRQTYNRERVNKTEVKQLYSYDKGR